MKMKYVLTTLSLGLLVGGCGLTPLALESSQTKGTLHALSVSRCDQDLCRVQTPMLWPPNHDLVNVGLTLQTQDAVAITVYSNEPDVPSNGDDHFSPDAKDLYAGQLRLRSERLGKGRGRVYLIVVQDEKTYDRSCCTVVVPHDQSAASIAYINQLAQAAKDYCNQYGSVPNNFVQVGVGPEIGPKQ